MVAITPFDTPGWTAYTEPMELRITLTPDQEAFVQKGMAEGRFQSAEAVALVAMERWEEYERRRIELIAELCFSDTPDPTEIKIATPQDADALLDRVKRRAMAHYDAKVKTPA